MPARMWRHGMHAILEVSRCINDFNVQGWCRQPLRQLNTPCLLKCGDTGIHAFLEVYGHRPMFSLEHMLAIIYKSYSMMALLYEIPGLSVLVNSTLSNQFSIYSSGAIAERGHSRQLGPRNLALFPGNFPQHSCTISFGGRWTSLSILILTERQRSLTNYFLHFLASIVWVLDLLLLPFASYKTMTVWSEGGSQCLNPSPHVLRILTLT